jgi:predicted dinucleotide-binding enzyme
MKMTVKNIVLIIGCGNMGAAIALHRTPEESPGLSSRHGHPRPQAAGVAAARRRAIELAQS